MKDFKDLDPNEKLDDVMKFLYNNPQRYQNIAIRFYLQEAQSHFDEMYDLMMFLVKEGYAERPKDEFKLTFAGSVFTKDIGYAKRAKQRRIKERYDIIQSFVLTIGSILAGIGTIALFAVEVYKIVTHS